MNDNQPCRCGFESSAELFWSDVTAQDGANTCAESVGNPSSLDLFRQHHDGIIVRNFCVLKGVQELFVSVWSGLDQNNIGFNIDELPGGGFEIRRACHNVHAAVRQHALQARANQR
jgi:hypothetical protein